MTKIVIVTNQKFFPVLSVLLLWLCWWLSCISSLVEMVVEARAQAEGAWPASQALSRWFQPEPGEFLNTEGDWTAVRQEDGRIHRVFLGGQYSSQISSC